VPYALNAKVALILNYFGSPVSGGKEPQHERHKGVKNVGFTFFSLRDRCVLCV
jgi:hypothetical protein